jgi:hypothetical protein
MWDTSVALVIDLLTPSFDFRRMARDHASDNYPHER